MSRRESKRYGIALAIALALWAFDRTVADIAAVAAIALIGTPHGAADIVRLRALAKDWIGALALAALYLLIAALVWRAFLAWPTPSLLMFVALSTLHFGATDRHVEPASAAYATAVVVVAAPFVFWHPTVAQYLRWIGVSASAAPAPAPAQTIAAAIVAAACLVATMIGGRRPWRTTLSWTLPMSLLLPPALGFALYFCALHSPRHWTQLRAEGVALPWKPIAATLAATLAIALWLLLREPAHPIAARTAQVLVIGLAALTVPHMLLDAAVRMRMRRQPRDVEAA